MRGSFASGRFLEKRLNQLINRKLGAQTSFNFRSRAGLANSSSARSGSETGEGADVCCSLPRPACRHAPANAPIGTIDPVYWGSRAACGRLKLMGVAVATVLLLVAGAAPAKADILMQNATTRSVWVILYDAFGSTTASLCLAPGATYVGNTSPGAIVYPPGAD
jgi:hypothetical protein